MGDEEERRELSEGLKEGELLSPCSTDSELGLSSKACTREKHKVKCMKQHKMAQMFMSKGKSSTNTN